MLAPGGLFIHLGPVSYLFSDLDEQMSAEEFGERFASFGFEVGEQRVVTNTLLRSSALLDHSLFDNLCFSAARKAD